MHDLVPGLVLDDSLPLDDHDERVALVPYAVKDRAGLGGALLAEGGKRRQLRR